MSNVVLSVKLYLPKYSILFHAGNAWEEMTFSSLKIYGEHLYTVNLKTNLLHIKLNMLAKVKFFILPYAQQHELKVSKNAFTCEVF